MPGTREPEPYGEVVVQRHSDGSIEILRADPVIGITFELLDQLSPEAAWTNEDGNLVLAEQVAYRPIRFDRDGRVVVCEQVSDAP
jgi:hypothetical protein